MDDSRRCTAKTAASGYTERCKKAAVLGSNVCATHGAAAPQVKRKARERVRDLVDPLLGLIEKAIEDLDRRRLYLHPSVVRLATLVFDRAGLAPTTKLEVEDNRESRAWAHYATAAERKQLMAIMGRCQKRMERGENPAGRPKPKPAPETEAEDEVTL